MAVDVSEPWLCCVTPIAQSTDMLFASAIMCATLSSVSTESPQVCEANSMVKGASFFLYSSSPFIDIVGYSKLLINEQSEQIETLRKIVRATEPFRLAEAEGKLMRLPTGDGGALVFRTSPEAPVRCALEVSKALKSHPDLRVRMGIHSGPVNQVSDLNEQANMAGAGI